MKEAVTGKIARAIDEYTINTLKMPQLSLMERAALSVANVINERESKAAKIVAICGPGNNGADGIAAARILKCMGFDTSVFLTSENVQGASLLQLEIAKNMGVCITDTIERADIIIDAIFGVGLSRDVEGTNLELIREVNNSAARVYAVDIPSGVCADDGRVLGDSIMADVTVTFGFHKLGLIVYPGAERTKEIVLADIGFMPDVPDNISNKTFILDSEVLGYIPKRTERSNKGTYGKVLVVAGSKDISGAAYLSGLGALRSGAGMTKIFTAKDNAAVIKKLLPEAMISSYDTESFDMDKLEDEISWCDVIVAGPGITTGEVQSRIVDRILDEKGLPIVLDADAINIISQKEELKNKLSGNMIVTPHVAEAARLLGVSSKEVADNVLGASESIRDKFGVTSVLKDSRTVISTDKGTYINVCGNNGMATAGSGDVLTGIIAAMLAKGMSVDDSALSGVYIHAKAGDIAAKKNSRTSMIAGDIASCIKDIFLEIEE